MQRTPVILLIIVSVGWTSAENGWKAGLEYRYELESRSLTGLEQQFSGHLQIAEIVIRPLTSDRILVKFEGAKQADIQKNLTDGPGSDISLDEHGYNHLQLSKEHVVVNFKNGSVENMVVHRSTPRWEVNLYKSLMNLFQIDTTGANLVDSGMNMVPKAGSLPLGTYKTMEGCLSGFYETQYDISPLPEYLTQMELFTNLNLHDQTKFQILKSRDLSKGAQQVGYTSESGINHLKKLLQRSSASRIILSGNITDFTILSSETEEYVKLRTSRKSSKALVFGRIRAVLRDVKKAEKPWEDPPDTRTVQGMVYEPAGRYDNGDDSASVEAMDGRIRFARERVQKGLRISNSLEESSSSSSSSSSSESSEGESSREDSSPEDYQPEISFAPDSEFLPYFYGPQGQESDQKDRVADIVRVAKIVGKGIHSPGDLTENATLAYYSILSHLVTSANTVQLQDATDILYTKINGSSLNEEYCTWLPFRDAVASSGTGPALLAIAQWLNGKKVSDWEAAELMATLASSARHPTQEFIDYYFEILKTKEVQDTKFLNTSILVSFGDLLRRMASNKGKLRKVSVMEDRYLPYLKDCLDDAMAKKDSLKIQVYVRALGNTAHPQVLPAFEPYLSGFRSSTPHQRLSMVLALDHLASRRPLLLRPILYRLHANSGETPDIRTAAVGLLMRTDPPLEMLQRIAEMAGDPLTSPQVSAAVTSALTSAASDGGQPPSSLSQKAKSVVHHLGKKEYGLQYSRIFIGDFKSEDSNPDLGYSRQLSYLQGQDSILPKAAVYNLRSRDKELNSASYIWSSADKLLNTLWSEFAPNQRWKTQSSNETNKGNTTYSFCKISNMLNLQLEPEDQLEGSFAFGLFGVKRFFAFDNSTIKTLPKRISDLHEKMQKGLPFNYSRFYKQESHDVGFPLLSGFQFVYSLDVPTLVSLSGWVTGGLTGSYEEHKLNGAAFNATLNVTYSSQERCSVGFTVPYTNRRYVTGVEKDVMVNLPVRIQLNLSEASVQTKMQPVMGSSEKQKIFHSSNTAYTTIHNNEDIKPYKKGENVKIIYSPQSRHFVEAFEFEEPVSKVTIDIQGDRNSFNIASLYKKIMDKGQTSLIFLEDEDEDEDFGYKKVAVEISNAPGLQSRWLEFGFSFRNEKNNTEKSSKNIKKSPSSGSSIPGEQRMEDLLRKAKNGIGNTTAEAFDTYLRFGLNSGYFFTLARVLNPANQSTRFLVIFKGHHHKSSGQAKPFQASLQMLVKEPALPMFGYEEALRTEPTTMAEGLIDIFHGSQPTGKVVFKGEMKRSHERKDFLESLSETSVCRKEMAEGMFLGKDCRASLKNAYFRDRYRLRAKYHGLPVWMSTSGRHLYDFLRQVLFLQADEDVRSTSGPKEELDFTLKISSDLKTADFSIRAPSLKASFQNFAIPQIVASNAGYGLSKGLAQKLLLQEPLFSAIIDGNQMTTFDNRTYLVELNDCYHVLSMYAPRASDDASRNRLRNSGLKFAVLVKENNDNFKEAMVIISTDAISLKWKEGKPQVTINGELFAPINKTSTFHRGQLSLQITRTIDDVIVLDVPTSGLTLASDGKRLIFALSVAYKGKVRGLAGTWNVEEVEDFTLPNGRIARDVKIFANAYALPQCSGRTPTSKEEGVKKKLHLVDVISQPEEKPDIGSCNVLGLKVIEDAGRICFSTRPFVTCSSECRPLRTVRKTVHFHCLPQSSDSKRWQELIRRGALPDFSRKGAHLRVLINLPESCIPK